MTFLIEKEAIVDEEERQDNLASMVKEHLNKLYEQLHIECHSYAPEVPLEEVLYQTGLGYLFPDVINRLQIEERPCNQKVSL